MPLLKNGVPWTLDSLNPENFSNFDKLSKVDNFIISSISINGFMLQNLNSFSNDWREFFNKSSYFRIKIGKGEFFHEIKWFFQDEITSLSHYINQMTDTMESLTTNLKNEVDAQTKEIKLQNTSFTNLLSNLDQGFIIMDFKGEGKRISNSL